MPRASIEYMNARRACKAASGGTTYSRTVEYSPDYEPDAFELAQSQINSFAIWAECSRAQYLAANGLTYADAAAAGDDTIPF